MKNKITLEKLALWVIPPFAIISVVTDDMTWFALAVLVSSITVVCLLATHIWKD